VNCRLWQQCPTLRGASRCGRKRTRSTARGAGTDVNFLTSAVLYRKERVRLFAGMADESETLPTAKVKSNPGNGLREWIPPAAVSGRSAPSFVVVL
jgi:hypothetical protein